MGSVVDVDSHVYEPTAIWDQYVPSELRGVARAAFYHEVDGEGNRLTILNGRPGRELNRSQLVRQAIWRPGMTPDDIGSLDPDVFQPLNPGAYDPGARLADMDAMGVDAAVVFPTLFTEYVPLVENPDAAATLARAYNDWIWDFAAQGNGRLHPVAIIPMHAPLLAHRELDRVAEKGFTSVMIRPAFYMMAQLEEHSAEARLRQSMRRLITAANGGADMGSRTSSKTFRTARCGVTSTTSASWRASTRAWASPDPTPCRAEGLRSGSRSGWVPPTPSPSPSPTCRTRTSS